MRTQHLFLALFILLLAPAWAVGQQYDIQYGIFVQDKVESQGKIETSGKTKYLIKKVTLKEQTTDIVFKDDLLFGCDIRLDKERRINSRWTFPALPGKANVYDYPEKHSAYEQFTWYIPKGKKDSTYEVGEYRLQIWVDGNLTEDRTFTMRAQ